MMSAKHLVAVSLAIFLGIVSASFGYGLVLLVRGPSLPREGAAARPAPLPPDVVALLRRSADQMRKGEVEQAILGYRRALTQGPSLEALLGLAEGEARAGREDVAIAEYERALRLRPRNETALLRLARAYAGRRETWEQAEARYREYLALAPGDAQAWLGLARVLTWRGSSSAEEIYARADVQPLLTGEDRRNHALALARRGRGQEAEPILSGIARSNPGDVDVLLSLGGVHASRRDWERALPLYRAALDRRPEDAQANLTYGQGLVAVGKYDAALAPLGKAARLLPSSAEAGLAYARALRAAGNPARADAEFDRISPALENDAATQREYGDLLMERKKYSKAIVCYRRALGLGLKDARLLAALGGALSANGRPNDALPFLEEAYVIEPSDRLGLELARLYRRLGRNDRALEVLAQIQGAPRPH
jgi:tetratricopeptide (TPR) repeat protein